MKQKDIINTLENFKREIESLISKISINYSENKAEKCVKIAEFIFDTNELNSEEISKISDLLLLSDKTLDIINSRIKKVVKCI